jgi:drug/metabolite transporter (DMT)-like permease
VQGRAKSAAGAGWAMSTSILWAMALVCLSRAGELSWLSQTAVCRAVSLVLFIPVSVVALSRARPADRQGPTLPKTGAFRNAVISICVGLLSVVGLSAMTMAVRRGPLAVAGVAVAQYSTVAVILGLGFLKERPRRHQIVGVVCTLVAVTMLSTVA